jgi:hypothetical protein
MVSKLASWRSAGNAARHFQTTSRKVAARNFRSSSASGGFFLCSSNRAFQAFKYLSGIAWPLTSQRFSSASICMSQKFHDFGLKVPSMSVDLMLPAGGACLSYRRAPVTLFDEWFVSKRAQFGPCSM